jgi:signal transduction histidine kinase
MTRTESNRGAGSVAARTAGGAALVALPVAAASLFQITYGSPTVHIAFEAIAGFIALSASFLLIGRVVHRRLFCDLVLAVALAIFAATNIARAFVPEITDSGWFLTTAGFLVGTALFTAAAFLPERGINRPIRAALVWTGGAITATAALTVIMRAVDPVVPPRTAADLLMAGLFSLSCFGFYRRAVHGGDELMRWLASGSALAALARLNYALPPSPSPGRLSTGDLLRIGFYISLMVGAAIEIVNYWKERSRLAVLEERRRIARELHDGLAQDLFFIVAKSKVLARRNEIMGLTDVADAASRALTESRRAITALSSDERVPLEFALGREAENAAKRFGLGLSMRLEPGIRAESEGRLALLRIAREAIANAARHGNASHVSVSLSNGSGVTLRIEDDGTGFDPNQIGTGFGLQSMEERALALGGELRVVSGRGRGTIVEAEIP